MKKALVCALGGVVCASLMVKEPSAGQPLPKAVDWGVKAKPGGALQLPTKGRAAPWLQPAPTTSQKKSVDGKTVASGARASVVKLASGQYLAFHVERGVIGSLVVPKQTRWIGFGARDELIAVARSGQIYAAPSVVAASSLSAWRPRARVQGAVRWDTAPDVLAGTDGAVVWVSYDGGRTFRKFKPKGRRARIAKLFVRRGGVVVLAEAPFGKSKRYAPWVLRKGNKRFKRTRLRVKKLERVGPWIWNRSWSCAAVLGRNGRKWIAPSSKQVNAAFNTSSWMAATQTTERLDGVQRDPDWRTPSYPPIPRRGRVIRGADPCPPPKSSGNQGGLGMGSGLLGGRRVGCVGVACLRSSVAPVAESGWDDFKLFRDARCAVVAGKDAWHCARDRPPRRLPHAAFVNQRNGTVRVGDLPKDCVMPQRVFSARGLGVLICQQKRGAALWVTDKSMHWHREYETAVAARDHWNASVAADGTLLIQQACARKAKRCSALVRRPLAPGIAGAWYAATAKGAMTHRPVIGGRALIAADHGGALALVLVDHERRKRLNLPVAIKEKFHSVKVRADGKIVLEGYRRVGKPKGPFGYYVSSDGKLLPAKLPPQKTMTFKGRKIPVFQAKPADPAMLR